MNRDQTEIVKAACPAKIVRLAILREMLLLQKKVPEVLE
jgi:hypothetical protein